MLEWRYKYTLGNAFMYVVSTVFITHLVFNNNIDIHIWNALFWIIIVFVNLNTVSKSFVLESKYRQLYYYSITSPQAVILAKIIYNNLLMVLFTILSYLIFGIFFGFVLDKHMLFFSTIFFGAVGLSSVITFTSAIAWRADSKFSLVAVLSLPLLLPIILLLVKLTNMAFSNFSYIEAFKFLLILLLLDVIIVALAYILFPFIWND